MKDCTTHISSPEASLQACTSSYCVSRVDLSFECFKCPLTPGNAEESETLCTFRCFLSVKQQTATDHVSQTQVIRGRDAIFLIISRIAGYHESAQRALLLQETE